MFFYSYFCSFCVNFYSFSPFCAFLRTIVGSFCPDVGSLRSKFGSFSSKLDTFRAKAGSRSPCFDSFLPASDSRSIVLCHALTFSSSLRRRGTKPEAIFFISMDCFVDLRSPRNDVVVCSSSQPSLRARRSQ